MTTILALLAAISADAVPHIRITLDAAGKCVTTWNGERVDHDELLKRAKARPDKTKTVLVDSDAAVPYRCAGSTIYTLQMAGTRFVAEPLLPKEVR